jgi:hypothetical protein
MSKKENLDENFISHTDWGFVSLVLRTEAMVIPFSLLQTDEHRLAMQRMTTILAIMKNIFEILKQSRKRCYCL